MDTVFYAKQAVEELAKVIDAVSVDETERFLNLILSVKKVYVTGGGRCLLALKFFAMRLAQLGIETQIVGEVCTTGIKEDELLIIGSISGEKPSMIAFAEKAKAVHANVALVCNKENSTLGKLADCELIIGKDMIPEAELTPASWNENDYRTIRPAGGVFEQSVVIVLDAIIARLMTKTDRGLSVINNTHANLE